MTLADFHKWSQIFGLICPDSWTIPSIPVQGRFVLSQRDLSCLKDILFLDLWLTGGRGVEEGWSGSLVLADANYYTEDG